MRFKDVARRLLPSTGIARSVILAEQNLLRVHETIPKFEVFDRLLTMELSS